MLTTLEACSQNGLNYKQDGSLFRVLCPFHHDASTPNLTIYSDDSWYCFACRANGKDGYAFVARLRGVSRRQVVEEIDGPISPTDELMTMLEDASGVVQVSDFKNETNLYASRACRDKLYAGAAVEPLFAVLKELDALEEVSYSKMQDIVRKVQQA